MKAAWYTKNGAARNVLVVGELPTPEPGPGEVLVRVYRSGINPSDVKSRRSRPLNADLSSRTVTVVVSYMPSAREFPKKGSASALGYGMVNGSGQWVLRLNSSPYRVAADRKLTHWGSGFNRR